jgi:hypothetical protein
MGEDQSSCFATVKQRPKQRALLTLASDLLIDDPAEDVHHKCGTRKDNSN